MTSFPRRQPAGTAVAQRRGSVRFWHPRTHFRSPLALSPRPGDGRAARPSAVASPGRRCAARFPFFAT